MYVIKGTYTQGDNKGKSFYLGKGGTYITITSLPNISKLQSYDKLQTAKMVATRFNLKNKSDERRYPEFTIPILFSVESIL